MIAFWTIKYYIKISISNDFPNKLIKSFVLFIIVIKQKQTYWFNFWKKHPLLWEQMWYEVITRLENPFFLSLSFHSQPFDLILHFIYVVKYFISSYLLLPLSSNLSFNIILFICIYICMVILFMKFCAMILKKLLSFSLITSHCLFFISL